VKIIIVFCFSHSGDKKGKEEINCAVFGGVYNIFLFIRFGKFKTTVPIFSQPIYYYDPGLKAPRSKFEYTRPLPPPLFAFALAVIA